MTDIERHLILIHRRGLRDAADFEAIAEKVRERAPDIEVFVVDSFSAASVTRRRAAERPTLVFSATQPIRFRPARAVAHLGAGLEGADHAPERLVEERADQLFQYPRAEFETGEGAGLAALGVRLKHPMIVEMALAARA